MTTIALSISVTVEQTAALDDLLADYNANRDTPVTATVYLETVLTGIIDDKVKHKFHTVANQLVEAARKLPYENRLALISHVQSAVPKD